MTVFCAIDTNNIHNAIDLCTKIKNSGIGIKLGLEFFNAYGPDGLKKISDEIGDLPLFVDLKYHDIPNTVAGAIRSLLQTVEPHYINVHAAGGRAMMEAAKEACAGASTKLLAVTVLTSLDDSDLRETGQQGPATDQVIRLARLSQDCGLDGVVCSSHEIKALRASCGPEFDLMVPGIRPAGSATGDQKRIMTPRQAMDEGATHLVIGRPITQSPDPAKTAQAILEELNAA